MKKILLVFIFVYSSCSDRQSKMEQLLTSDSIQNWNYEWKRNFPEEYGKTYSFNSNGDFSNYLYIKNNGVRKIYLQNRDKTSRWLVTADSILTIQNKKLNIFDKYLIIKYNSDIIQLVNLKFKDTSYLLKENKNFKIVFENKPKNYLLRRRTCDTIWIFDY